MPAHARTTGREGVECALFTSLDPLACLITSCWQLCSCLWLAAAVACRLLALAFTASCRLRPLVVSLINYSYGRKQGGKCLLCLMLVTPLPPMVLYLGYLLDTLVNKSVPSWPLKPLLLCKSIPSTCDSSLPSEIPIVYKGFCLLGCRIGPLFFCEEVLPERVRKVSLERIRDMEDPHLEMTLLYSLPKFSYILRRCSSIICEATSNFDAAIRDALDSGIPYRNGPGQRPLCPAAEVGSTSVVLPSMPRLVTLCGL